MKVLIVSHNCISSTSNMGKTLLSYFHGFPREDIAQFYIHFEEPIDDTLCCNYYRFTDIDAFRSIISFRVFGKIFGERDICTDRITARGDAGWAEPVYRYGERRTAMVYALRNLLWKCSRWNTERLQNWLTAFDPDIIFFASGDYGFMYDVARTIADYVNKPLAVCCVDDFYLYNRNENSFLGRLGHRHFLKTVGRTMERSSAIFTICDSLKREYEPYFQKECYVLHTSAERRELPAAGENCKISYLGNLELKRYEQLIAIGRTLQSMDIPGVPRFLDVYSGERDGNILKYMTTENGIRFHGSVSAEEVLEIMRGSMAVIHTESFETQMRKIVRHSISTKIPESLMNGPCLIAYGPEEAASIEYLKENGAAYVITAPDRLEQGLKEILSNQQLRREIVGRARKLAQKNHDIYAEPLQLRQRLVQICEEQQRYEDTANQLRLSPRQYRENHV